MDTHALELLEFSSPSSLKSSLSPGPLALPSELHFQRTVIDDFLARTGMLSVGSAPVAKANR